MIASFGRETLRILARNKPYTLLYGAMLVLSLHWAAVLYVHSTYLEQFVSREAVGTLFVIGSALTVLAFLFISRILEKAGNFKLTIGLAILECCVLVGMSVADSLRTAVPLFILHQAIVPLLLFNLDVFVESLTTDETKTGRMRGTILTSMNIATALAPLCIGLLLGSGAPRFGAAYLTGAALMIPFIFLIYKNFRSFTDSPYPSVEILSAIHDFWHSRDLRIVFLAHFLLQLFFAWMVIYVPLYLATEIGLGWDEIGQVLFIGLFAYVLLEYPIGRMADLYFGEREMMMLGFLILAVSTAWISLLTTTAIIPWMVAMFVTRTGASLVEATTESYFFKHTKGSDANIISFFRITRPLAIVCGALLGSLALLYMPFQYIFAALGCLLLLGILFCTFLVDTR